MSKVHSEIIYRKKDDIPTHSDTCPPDCDFKNISKEYREYLHNLLDEWLDKSEGTGIFYIKEEGFNNYGNEE